MSIRICCGTDQHKSHDPDCPKQLEWRRKQNEKLRQTNIGQKRTRKGREHRGRRGSSDPVY